MKRFESLLDKLGSYYCESLSPEKTGMLFKVKKCGDYFLHTDCSGKLMHKLGYEREDIVGKNLFQFLPHEVVNYKRQHYQRAWEGNETVYKSIYPNDNTYLVYLVPIVSQGEVIELIGHGIDITKWDLNNNIVTISDLNGTIKFVSANSLQVSDSDIEDLLETKIDIYPEDIELYKLKRKEIIDTKKAHHMKIRIIKNGITLTMLSIGIPVLHKDKVICLVSFSEIISK